MPGIDTATYTRDELVALLGGSMTPLAGLPRPLEERPDGIWLSEIDDRDLDWMTEQERATMQAHPTWRPTSAPALPLPHFTVQQFVAFEDCVRVFRSVYLFGIACYACESEGDTLVVLETRWKLNEGAVNELRRRSPRAVDLVLALMTREPTSEDTLEKIQPTDKRHALPRHLAHWRHCLYAHVSDIDSAHGGAATARQAIAYLKRLDDTRLLADGAADRLRWRTDSGQVKEVALKTVQNALSSARNWRAQPLE